MIIESIDTEEEKQGSRAGQRKKYRNPFGGYAIGNGSGCQEKNEFRIKSKSRQLLTFYNSDAQSEGESR